jgi:PKD repeat protein
MDKRIVFIFLGVFIIVSGIFICKRINKSGESSKVDFIISPGHEITQGESINYEDRTQGATSWYWDFGDGQIATDQKGDHLYDVPGIYLVKLTVNGNKFSDTFSVNVKPIVISDLDTGINKNFTISGPASAKVGEIVNFTDNTPEDVITHWKFGESGIEDGIGKTISYVFKTPGKKMVVATHDGSRKQGTLVILIKPNAAPPTTGGGGGGGGGNPPPTANASDASILTKLQAIASGDLNDFKRNYPVLVKALCGDETITVTINEGKTKTFSSYCNDLNIRNPRVVSVKTTKDPVTKCITALSVNQE